MQNNTKTYRTPQALEPASSVFVSANAGSGKTRLLSDRVLSLLLHGVAAPRILCLTYTKAAAAEMQERILASLGAWVMADHARLSDAIYDLTGVMPEQATLARARSLFARVLDDPEGVRVQTLHGFCQSLLGRFPLEAGVSPHFTVMDSRSEAELLNEARLRLLSRAQHEDAKLKDALAMLACRVTENSLKDLLSELLKHKQKLRRLFEGEEPMDTLWALLGITPGDTPSTIIDRHFRHSEETLSALRHMAGVMQSGAATDQKHALLLAHWLEYYAQESSLGGYFNLFLNNDGAPRKTIATKSSGLDEAQHALLAEEKERALALSHALKALDIAGCTSQLLTAAQALLEIYEHLKRQRGLMDYDDLILSAVSLLEKPGIAPWVLYKLDGGIDHILVDEAQDTSPAQWAIVRKLTEEFFDGKGRATQERSLFVVGDEKQSIYSFQGADPAQLGNMRAHFAEKARAARITLHELALERSFRSAPDILQAVDAVFANPAASSGLMTTGRLTHIPTKDYAGLVEVWPVILKAKDEPENTPSLTTRLARQTASHIQRLLRQGEVLDSTGMPIQPGDILILLRQRGTLADRLVRALKSLGIPVAGQDRMELSENLAVQDLMALGQCLLLPEDDFTLACVLKSPLIGLDEEALYRLAYGKGKMPLWRRLAESMYKEAYERLADLRAKADYITPFALYSYLLDTAKGRARMLGRMGLEYADAIDEFLQQALLYERGHAPSLQGFLHWLVSAKSEIKRDMEQGGGMVRIMTVHGAKGLQAPVVILPDTVSMPVAKQKLNWHEEEGSAWPFWVPKAADADGFTSALRQRHKDEAAAEYRRLLYVALTRPMERLYIGGACGYAAPSPDCWYQLIWDGLAPIAETVESDQGRGLRYGSPRSGVASGLSAAQEASFTDYSWLHKAPLPEPTPAQPLAPSRLSGQEPPAASPLSQAHVFARGTLIHRLLQLLPDIPPEKRRQVAAHIVSKQDGLSDTQRQECLDEALHVLEHPDSAFLFTPGGLAEVPLAGCVKVEGHTVTVTGQIDRLHIGPQEVWIIDFKSNRAAAKEPADVPVHYLRQMKLYQLLMQQIYSDKRIRCALLWTAEARLMHLADSLLDEVPASFYI